MPSKHKPSFWQKVTHAPSQSYADIAPAHPSRPHRASPYGAPSTSPSSSLTASALAAAEHQQASAPRRRTSSVDASSRNLPAPAARKQTLQYSYEEQRFMLVDDEAQAGSSEGPGTTQWRHPSLRKDCARSDVGPSSRVKEPSSSRKNPTKKKAKGPAEDGQGFGAKPRRASTSDQQPAAVVQHHHHYYHPPSADVPGFSSPLPLASPLTSQVGSSVSDNVRRPSALPRHTQQPAFVNPTPPTSDIGSSPYSDMGKELAPALDQGLLKALALDANVNSDLDSDEDALFYTPRSSMTFNFQTEDASSSDGHSQYEEDVGLSPKAAAQQSGLTAPSLTFQPPTPTSFPLQDGQSRSPFSPGQAPGQEKNLFSEYSFHPDRVRSQQPEAPPSPMAFLQEDEPAPTQPPRPAFFNENRSSSPNSSSPPSSSPRMSALGGDDDDAYSGVLLYALPEEDEGPNSIAALPPAPPRLPSIPHISPLATPSLTNLGNSSSLHPGGNSRKAESVRSAASSSSRYSQTSYASYASELDAPKPRIISANSTPFSTASTVSSPLSSPMRPTPSSSSYSRNRSTSPSQSSSNLKSPMFPGAPSSDSPPTAPSSLYSMPPRLTPFLPRPTSMLINSYDMAGSYPSAPASVVSDSGHRQHRKDSLPALSLGAAGGQRTDESRSMRSFNPGASEGGFQRRRLMSEGASMREVRSTPQVMGDSAKGQGGTSMSGGVGYSSLTLPSAVYRPAKSPARYTGKIAYDTMGMPDTTMATIMVSSSARRPSTPVLASSTSMSSLLRRNSVSATPAHLVPTPVISVQYTAHTPPPKKLSSTSVLVRIWAVAVDGYDALAARDASPGFVPGRSFTGKVVEWGDACAGMFSKGEFVFGLRDLKRSGALSEFIVIERRYLAKAPHVTSSGIDGDEGLTLEDIASLPLLGVTAHRAVGGIPRGSRALVLLQGDGELGSSSNGSDWGVGLLACQELVARGVIVVLQVSSDFGEGWARQHVPDLREGHVRVGDPVEIVHLEHEGSFDLVLDCVGGRRVYDASRRIISTGGQFTTLKGDTSSTSGAPALPASSSSTSYRSLRRAFVKKDRKHIDYRVISPSGSGPIVDFMGEDVRDILEWIASTAAYKPVRVAKVVPFERAAEAFAVNPRTDRAGGKLGALQGSYECEEQVWGVRLVS